MVVKIDPIDISQRILSPGTIRRLMGIRDRLLVEYVSDKPKVGPARDPIVRLPASTSDTSGKVPPVAFLIPDVYWYYEPLIFETAAARLAEFDFPSVLRQHWEEQDRFVSFLKDLTEAYRIRAIAGVLTMPPEDRCAARAAIRIALAAGCPMVNVDRWDPQIPTVQPGQVTGMFQLTKRVCRLGYKHLVVLQGRGAIKTVAQRHEGLRMALWDYPEVKVTFFGGLQPDYCGYGEFTDDPAIVPLVLESMKLFPTAIVSDNLARALDVVRCVTEAYGGTPPGLAVAHFDNPDRDRLGAVGLFATRIDLVELGAAAADLLVKVIKRERVSKEPLILTARVTSYFGASGLSV